jgi:LCP family protein required for cell wall assembly
MLLYLDPDARRAVVLSVPLDLSVEIPGYGEGRINTAYALGEQDGTGGLALARQTVSNTFGIPVEHAALLDFRACSMLIDAVGGLDVDVPFAISDLTYPDGGTGYDPFYLPAGQHHLDGEMALKYARTRATAGGDFDRATRQRQLLLAVRERITNLDLLPDLISRSPELWSGLRDAVETDLTLSEIVDLAVLASRVPIDQIVTAGIDQACTSFWTTSGGADVLILDPDAAEVLISDLFVSPSAAAVTQ